MNLLLPAPIVLPLLAAALSILFGRSRTVQRLIGITTMSILVGVAVVIPVEVKCNGVVVSQASDWQVPTGISPIA
ncbi:MAG: Na+/H+ antiporter subunit D, partial [Ilumatobacteraceae bacterium]